MPWTFWKITNRDKRMEIHDELEIEIFHTLEQLRRMNKALRRHQDGSSPNAFMVEQIQDVKARLTQELQVLMSQATEMQWATL
jgi:hypothetical protein